jgi:hypothetical protein
LHDAQLFLPIIVTFQHKIFTTLIDRITIFPAFCSVDRLATIPLLLAESFFKLEDQDHDMFDIASKVNKLSIYLIDTSDMPSIYALVEDMAVNFPFIEVIYLFFERRCEIVSFLFIVNNYKRT